MDHDVCNDGCSMFNLDDRGEVGASFLLFLPPPPTNYETYHSNIKLLFNKGKSKNNK
jgi:hypothetical protein